MTKLTDLYCPPWAQAICQLSYIILDRRCHWQSYVFMSVILVYVRSSCTWYYLRIPVLFTYADTVHVYDTIHVYIYDILHTSSFALHSSMSYKLILRSIRIHFFSLTRKNSVMIFRVFTIELHLPATQESEWRENKKEQRRRGKTAALRQRHRRRGETQWHTAGEGGNDHFRNRQRRSASGAATVLAMEGCEEEREAA